MKRILFIFMLMVIAIPLQVKAEYYFFNYSDYYYSNDIVEGGPTREVEKVIEGDKTIYKYRTRDYLYFPIDVTVNSKDFNILSLAKTNIPLEEIKATNMFDVTTTNNCYSEIRIVYGGSTIGKRVYVEIPNYIEVPNELLAEKYTFNIWDYIETNVNPKESVEIIGEYNLNVNGEYELLLKYNDISEKTIVLVNIKENEKKLEKEAEKDISNEVDNENDNQTIEKVLTYETKNYISNYYTYNNDNIEKKCDCNCSIAEIPVPINKMIYRNDNSNDLFYYVSYIFYGLVIILLSIFVVRKK